MNVRATATEGTGQGVRKVVHVVTSLHFGGVERQMQIIAKFDTGEEHTRFFVALGPGGAAEKAIRLAGQEVSCLDCRPSVYSLGTFWALYRLLRKRRPDVVHTHGAEANFLGLPAAFLAGVPVRIGEEMGVPTHSAKARMGFRIAYGLAHRVIAISPVVADFLVKSNEVPASKLRMLEYPVTKPEIDIRKNSVERQRPRCGYVGRLVSWKNVDAIIESLAELARRGRPFDLWIIGDGPQRDELAQLASKQQVASYVHFIGFQERPQNYLADCDLFILSSSEREGYCLALVEAMACGIPTIATRVGIAPGVIHDGETGWLVPPGDREALTEVLDNVLTLPPGTRRGVGAEAQRQILLRNPPVEYLRQLGALYREVAAERLRK